MDVLLENVSLLAAARLEYAAAPAAPAGGGLALELKLRTEWWNCCVKGCGSRF
jgi:hypothetical protein